MNLQVSSVKNTQLRILRPQTKKLKAPKLRNLAWGTRRNEDWACSGFRISTLNFGLLTVVPVLQVEEGAKKALKPKA